MDEMEKELKISFLDEAAQLLSDTEQCFLDLEGSPDSSALIEKIFRLAHNLKGSARAVGFVEMGEFTHIFESLLLKIKNKDLGISSGIVTLLLACNDHLTQWVQILKENLDASMDSSALASRLEDAIQGRGQESVAPPSQVASPEPTPEIDPMAAQLANAAKAFDQLEETVTESVAAPQVITPADTTPAAQPILRDKPIPAAAAAATSTSSGGATSQDESIRVSSGRLEKLINNVGELVILQTVLNQQKNAIASTLVQKTISQLSKITKDIQDISMSLRMVPLKATLQKLTRIVRDTSKSLNKEVTLILSGEETELDKTVVDHLGDPLVHIIRNSVDHGIEMPEERVAAGKPAHGTVRLSAYHQGGQIVIEIKDDGKGMDPNRLREKAIEKGLLRPDQKISDQEALNLIFAPGFSTKAEVTEISGRGVGMDVVKTNIERVLQGEVQLSSQYGVGTTLKITLPLTMAIIDGMVIRVGDEQYIVPLAHVFESVQPEEQNVHHVTGVGEVLSLRDEHLPIYRLDKVLARKSLNPPAHESIALVVRSGRTPFAILVDDILVQQQVVIKRLGVELQQMAGISGGAVLGDGKAALILDLPELIHYATKRSRPKPTQAGAA